MPDNFDRNVSDDLSLTLSDGIRVEYIQRSEPHGDYQFPLAPVEPVTVGDLLDAIGIHASADQHGDFPRDYLRASHDVRLSFIHVARAVLGLVDPTRLSPDERTEFDRRTSGAGSDGR